MYEQAGSHWLVARGSTTKPQQVPVTACISIVIGPSEMVTLGLKICRDSYSPTCILVCDMRSLLPSCYFAQETIVSMNSTDRT